MPRLALQFRLAALAGLALVTTLACSPRSGDDASTTPGDTGAASGRASGGALANTEWTLVQLEGDSVIAAAPGGTPSIRFTADDSLRVGGNTGCNTFGGSYEVSGNTLRFRQLVSTLRACADSAANDQGNRFMAALNRTDGYRIEGSRLLLLAGSDTVARFERSGGQ